MREIYDKRWTSFESREEGVKRVLEDEFAFFDESLPLELQVKDSCELAIISLPEQFGIVWVTRRGTFFGKVLQF